MKEKFIKSTLILLISGFITKILGMIIKIVMAREIGTEGLGTYMLVLPTFMLLINLSQFGFPIAIAKLISEENRNTKKLLFTIIPIMIIINITLMITIILLAPFISNNLLHNSDTYLCIIAMALVIPFTSISSLCRSYFFGKNRMFPHAVSHIVENIVRLVIMIFGIKYIINLELKYIVSFLILINIISEITSSIILIIFLPKNIKITKNDLIPDKKYLRDSLNISIPNTTSRLIGSIGFFLEPIILTNTLIRCGFSSSYITYEYGVISGYVIPLILLPSFFTLAISDALLPVISRDYSINNIKAIRSKVSLAILISLIIGIPITLVLIIIPTLPLKLIYHTTSGVNYIRILAPICLLQYIESPLSSVLDALGKSMDNMKATIISTVSRTLLLLILPISNLGMWSLIITISVNIILTTLYQIKKVRYYLT